MKFLVIAAAIAVLGLAAGTTQRRGRGLVDSATWKVASESDDHITYIRRPVETTTPPPDNVDCNKTTTTPAPTRRSFSRSRLDTRSGAEGGRRWKSTPATTSPTPMNYDGYDGDHLWQVSHRTDDHITYTRRGSSSSSHGQGQGQPGELRRLGRGRDSVLARVVVPGKQQEYTEEALVEGVQPAARTGGHPTNELVHPYVKKTKVTPTSTRSNRTKSLKSGRRPKSQSASTHDEHPPRIGEVVNGWVVVNKTKDSISWERWGSKSSSSSSANAAAVANIQARNNENRLRSLKSSRPGPASRGKTTRGKQLIPNQEGQLVEGFPRIFNTYSRAFYVNERNIDAAGSIRTSMSNTANWNVGDELAGWIVISKDHRGIVWQRKPTPAPSASPDTRGEYVLNEEDLLEELNKQGGDEEESSESDSSSDSESNEGDNIYRGPPGTWYLAKETKNSITWQRDNTPEDVIFEMNAYPRIGDVQSGWKVKSKSRGHITWGRINSDGSEADSNEE